MSTPTTRFRPVSPLREWSRVIAAGALLAIVLFAYLVPSGKQKPPALGFEENQAIQVATPQLDRELLATVSDASAESRMVVEEAALAHLLEKSLGVVPTVAEALGRPEEPLAIDVLRGSPDSFRGAWLWYSGKLGYLSPGKSGHPLDGYKVYEGFLETNDAAGSIVMFRTSLPSPELQVGDWVRIEGFFLKLRDSHVLPEAKQAPLLVGAELIAEPKPWEPVTALDPALLDTIRDGVFEAGEGPDVGFKIVDEQDARADLEASQSDALWHLASFARRASQGPDDTLENWRKEPAFTRAEQMRKVRAGGLARGTRFRVLGSFVMSRWSAANPNPIGVSHWSTVWVTTPDLGGKLLPVWVPQKVTGFRFGDPVEVRAHYFKRMLYETGQGGMALTPVFVAARLDRYVTLPPSPVTMALKYGFAAAAAGIVVLLYFLNRRDRGQSEETAKHVAERRRKRVAVAMSAPSDPS
ncbi:MAG: hypothetical protein IT457_10680 [Planctomycetes bacterium]|nr:hypothetical protein [Planctomycetota bacterium]